MSSGEEKAAPTKPAEENTAPTKPAEEKPAAEEKPSAEKKQPPKGKGKGKGKRRRNEKGVKLTKEQKALRAKKRKTTKRRVQRRKWNLSKLKKPHLSIPVPEGLRKRWERENRQKLKLAKAKKIKAEKMITIRKKQAERIREYDVEYVQMEEERKNKILAARKQGSFFKPHDPKMAIVIRIRGINRVSPKVRKVLQLFRLLQIHNAVFIKLNKATVNMLKLVQPYIAYGYPSVDTIRKLLYKRGFAKIRHRPGAISRIPIMDNDLITRHLGRFKIETVEDIVHEIVVCGPHFTACCNFLWPFKLQCPRKGYRGRKRRHFLEGGSYGNWEGHINHFVEKML